YTTSGTYTYSTLNAAGCDSTATLNLTIRYSTTSSSTVDVCDSYTWNGNTYTTSGTYTYSTLNAAGCDSTATLNLTIRYSTTSSSTVDVCDNYTWNGNTYTTSGTYTYSTTNAAGCDSTATLNLTIRNSSTSSSTVDVCDSYTWNGNTYTTSGTYTYSTSNAAGCDSTATLNLTIRNSSTSSSTVDVCDSYTWNGNTYTTSGTYTYSTTNAAGCDSTATLNLTIRNSSTSSSTVDVCDSYTWNGNTYTTSGTYTYSTLNAAGCDSTATLNLTIRYSTTSSSTVDVCDTYTWNGNTYTTSGTYTYSTLNAAGCDSTATLNLTIRNSSTSSSTVDVCDTYTWNGNTYTTSGTYTYSTLNAAGCDSTATLNLTIRYSSTSSTTVDVCDSYTWNGNTYTTSGTYTYSTLNAAGCDSTATLNLTIRYSSTSSTTVDVCDTYTWNGNTYTTSGTYTFSTLNAAGCDSTATLNLTIRYSSTSSSTVDVCDSYTWNGNTYTTSGTYTYSTLNAAGCDSTATLNLTIRNSSTSSTMHTACDSYTWNGNTYTSSGTYTYSTTNSAGCDSTASLILTINASSSSSETQAACVSFYWPIDGNNYSASGTYTHVETNGAGCNHTYTLNLTIYSPIVASASTIGTIQCYGGTVDVNLMISGGTAPYTVAENTVGLTAGTYTFNITDDNGCTGSTSLTITQPTQVIASAVAVSPINCFGESTCVTIGASGGVGPYLGTGTNCFIMAGSYTYTVYDNNGCIALASLNIPEPPKIEITYSIVAPTCSTANGSATATVIGGVPGYSYSWSNGQTTQTAIGLTPGNYSVTVTDVNGCSQMKNITVVAGVVAPPTPGAIMGSPGACRNTSGVVYSIAPVSTATSYNWILPAGATGSSSGTSITLSFSSTYNGGFICVEAVNACGTSSTSCMNIPVLSVKPAKPGPVMGPAIACGPAVYTYSILPVVNATSYNWTVSGTGVTIMSGQGTTSIQVSVPSTFGQGIVGVTAQNCLGVSAVSSMYITGFPQHSSPLFGPGYVCPGTNGVNYSISVIQGTSYYDWEVISGDMAIVSETNNTCIVDFPAGWTSGILRVTTYNACGGFSRDYNLRSAPTQPLSITGPAANLCNQTGVTYSISAVAAATGYTWTVPAGVTIVTNAGTSIVVDFGPTFTSSGNICVTADNACGQSVARCYNVTARPPQSGAIQGPFSVCKSQSAVLYTILPVAGATSYSWSITGGPTLTAGDTSATVNFMTATSASATLTVNTQNSCGLGSPSRLTILVNMGCREESPVHLMSNSGLLLTIFPNPSQGVVELSINSNVASRARIEVMDILGSLMASNETNLNEGLNRLGLDLSDLAKGIYFVNVKMESGKTENVRLVLE
ncbi:MAG: T9SS type A sorting domain-containing protein, partial [Bacteroidetes bacterium]